MQVVALDALTSCCEGQGQSWHALCEAGGVLLLSRCLLTGTDDVLSAALKLLLQVCVCVLVIFCVHTGCRYFHSWNVNVRSVVLK